MYFISYIKGVFSKTYKIIPRLLHFIAFIGVVEYIRGKILVTLREYSLRLQSHTKSVIFYNIC